MKIRPLLAIIIMILLLTTPIYSLDNVFNITSKGITNGIIDPKYGINGQYIKGDIPYYSLPIDINNPPERSKSFALVILDHDAIPVTGFTWIHWCCANITKLNIEENSSRNNPNFIQGVNSWYSPLLKNPLSRSDASYYGGMVPPDKTHRYTIICYALDCVLPLENGFFLNQLYYEIESHIIDTTSLVGKYKK